VSRDPYWQALTNEKRWKNMERKHEFMRAMVLALGLVNPTWTHGQCVDEAKREWKEIRKKGGGV